jgi:hypothetical protein
LLKAIFYIFKMNINSIFNLFLQDPSVNSDDENSLLIDFSEHPLYWLGGFNKIMNHHVFFKTYTLKSFKNLPPNFDKEEIEKAGEILMFEKAWGFIKNINISNQFHIECINNKSSLEFISNLDVIILFFVNLEDYEKCKFLKDIQDKIKENLNLE